MLAASFMNRRGQVLTRSTSSLDSFGASPEAYAPGVTMWGHLSSPSQRMLLHAERYAAPVTATWTTHAGAPIAAGDRLTVDSLTYDILGVDTTAKDVWHAALSEIV